DSAVIGASGPAHEASLVEPTQVLEDATQLAAGYDFACALLRNGRVACWGANHGGQLGVPQPTTSAAPLAGPGVERVVEVLGMNRAACARRSDATVWCWGDIAGDYHAFDPARNGVHELASLLGATALAAGDRRACAALPDGAARCWGAGDGGVYDVPGVRRAR